MRKNLAGKRPKGKGHSGQKFLKEDRRGKDLALARSANIKYSGTHLEDTRVSTGGAERGGKREENGNEGTLQRT